MSARRRLRDLLRSLWHRQDHAVGRSEAHAGPVTTSTAGDRKASSISKAAAMPSASSCLGEAEPEIYAASKRFGAVLENVVLDEDTREVDFDDGSKTENTRSAYPLDFIPNASRTGPRAASEECGDARRRCLRCAAADRKTFRCAGDVSLPVRSIPPRLPAPSADWATSRSRNSRPASSFAHPCRWIRPCTATCSVI